MHHQTQKLNMGLDLLNFGKEIFLDKEFKSMLKKSIMDAQ